MDVPTSTPRLESIPSEARHQILSLLDLQQLRKLVHASPMSHAQYRRDRWSLLCNCLERSLVGSNIDPRVVPVTRDTIWSYLHGGNSIEYENWRSRASASLRTGNVTLLEATDTATFFLYFVNPPICSYDAYKRAVAPVRAETKIEQEPRSLIQWEDIAEIGRDARDRLDEIENELHY